MRRLYLDCDGVLAARDKRGHAREGDVLVDDQQRHRHLWEEAGGIFVHHKNAGQSLGELASYFPLGQPI